ncbi:MAG: UDP-N-acetylmuramoyl-L-alanyl-D-glutamate--2,6-diaminopimelate ligase [bacterium]|jgi:UDP-N-acetylmuramoyl-L-alanyl-D-glutamate--2,6-diaminopimelate ligase
MFEGERVKSLAELITGIPCEVMAAGIGGRRAGPGDIKIKGLAYHSAKVNPGFLFVAIEGTKFSGNDFIDEAINRGAVVVATSDPRRVTKSWVTVVQTRFPRRFLAQVANRFYDFPARKLQLIGVTGTNGKTTTCYLTRAVLQELGQEPGFIGTIEYWDGVERRVAGNTTPESLDMVQMLFRMVNNGVRVCVSEVSSHALELDRVFDLDFRVGVFTNLTQDHLDFHRTMENYRRAKMKLFQSLTPGAFAVANFDDAAGAGIPALTKAKVIGFGTKPEPELILEREHNVIDYIWGEVKRVSEDGLECNVYIKSAGVKPLPVRLKLAGRHNLFNLLAVFGIGRALGWDEELIRRGVERLDSVPGRMERIWNDKGLGVYIDYAHTPDALKRVLVTVREWTKGRVLVVFGCGGDRDRGKRPLMGSVAAQLADVVIVTSDNPRSEEPVKIIEEILSGIEPAVRQNKNRCMVEIDRREAIRQALIQARPGDTVVIAGKGHEDYQIVGSERYHFDDREVAWELLRATQEL